MLYESERDRREQYKFADWVCELYDPEFAMTYEMTETTAPWDISLFIDRKLYALIEFKRRIKTNYPTLAIDVSKIDSLVECSMFLKVDPILVVKREDVGGYWYWRCNKKQEKGRLKRIKIRGIPGEGKERTDDVYHIPYSKFCRFA